ncbi:MAG: hypothetical protein DWG80_02040 [Chloroflexi bacterium]|nr:hypothetical protein [Chloroflexota bacterium]
MPAIPKGPLSPQQNQQVANLLRQRLLRQVAIEVWTREPQAIFTGERDDGRHAQAALELARQIKSLHPMLTLTPYDIDRSERVAAERGIEHSPTITLRCGGKGIRTVGLFFGPFSQAFLDALSIVSVGEAQLSPATKAALRGIDSEVTIEAFLTPFDPISVQMIPMLTAFAVEGKKVRVTLYEASQFPVLAGKRMISQVPLLTINGKRFVGLYGESDLCEQIVRVVEGNEEPVVRERVLATPYLSEDDAIRMGNERAQAAQQARAATPGRPPGAPPSSGLYVPGRD